MKLKCILAFLVVWFSIFPETAGQRLYSKTMLEFIFSSSMVSLNDNFLNQYPEAGLSRSNLRFTVFWNIEKDWHLDFTKHVGLITGVGLRNVGLCTDEVLPILIGGSDMEDYKIVRRLYTVGAPLIIKAGSFKNRLYFYLGGEYEIALHYKEKYWTGSHKRSGQKTKYDVWLGSQTPRFIPSVLCGIQLPGGFNIKVKYYINDFLNHNYTNQDESGVYNVSDLSRYKSSRLGYISLTWQFSPEYIKSDKWKKDSLTAAK